MLRSTRSFASPRGKFVVAACRRPMKRPWCDATAFTGNASAFTGKASGVGTGGS